MSSPGGAPALTGQVGAWDRPWQAAPRPHPWLCLLSSLPLSWPNLPLSWILGSPRELEVHSSRASGETEALAELGVPSCAGPVEGGVRRGGPGAAWKLPWGKQGSSGWGCVDRADLQAGPAALAGLRCGAQGLQAIPSGRSYLGCNAKEQRG